MSSGVAGLLDRRRALCETGCCGCPLAGVRWRRGDCDRRARPGYRRGHKNVLLLGRRAALGTSLGVSAGLSVWTLAAAVGVASVLRASAVAFTVLKLIGALYLIWLGLQALRAASHSGSGAGLSTANRPAMGALGGFRQGLLSDLANPKIGIFFTSLLPQFVDPGHSVLLPFLALGAVFVAMTALWLSAYCLIAARAATTLQRPRVRAAMDRITGVVLIVLGVRVAIEHR